MVKSDKIRKIVVWVFIVLFSIFVLTIVGYYGYCALLRYEMQEVLIQQTKTSKFEDFSTLENDFKTVADIAFEYKTDILSSEISLLLIDVNENDTYVSTYDFDIELNEEKKRAVNTVYYAFWNEGVTSLITSVDFINENQDLLFCSEDGWYAIVYCPSDSPNIENIEEYMGKDAGIVKLSGCWYQVIRHPSN